MRTVTFIFLLLCCAVNQATAEYYGPYKLRVEYNGVFYRTDGNEAIVTSREEFEHDEIDSIIPPDASFKVPVKPTLTYEGDIVIPEKIFTEESEEGIPVIGIDFGAFAYAPGLLSVELPSTIQWIASYAFYDSPNISSIGPIDNVTGIGRASFKGCSSLTDFTVPDNTPGLLCSLFYDSGLQTLKLHKNIISIDNSIVQNCKSLERVICEVEDPGLISWNQTANPTGSTDSNLGFWIDTDCILEVPAQSVVLYRNDPMWRMFSEIRAIGSGDLPETFVPMVREDRVWEYYVENTQGPGFELWRMKFDGTEEKNGRIYGVFRAFDGTAVRYDSQNYSYNVEDGYVPDERALLREENGKVYVSNTAYGNDAQTVIGQEYGTYDTENPEILLYDFTQRTGNRIHYCFQSMSNSGYSPWEYWYHSELEIADYREMEIAGENCRVLTLSDPDNHDKCCSYCLLTDYRLIEGIGADKDGTLYRPMIGERSLNHTPAQINNVYDLDGNVIYQGKNTSADPFRELSVDKVSTSDLTVYGGDGSITVECGNSPARIIIFSSDGLVRHDGVITADPIHIGDLQGGVYFVKAVTESGTVTRRVLVGS